MVLGRFNMAAYFRKVFILNGQRGIEHGQPLSVLDQQFKLCVLVLEFLHLNKAFVDFGNSLLLLALERLG